MLEKRLSERRFLFIDQKDCEKVELKVTGAIFEKWSRHFWQLLSELMGRLM
jgi:hypothetical protein